MHKAFLIIVSAPSGCGKTTVTKSICQSLSNIALSVSHTTRKPRDGEINEKDYNFVSKDFFEEKIKQNFFLEYAKLLENFYGSSKESVNKILNQGVDVVFDIDYQGMNKIKKSKIDAISIFLLPPSISELQKRLIARGVNNGKEIEMRLNLAKIEIQKSKEYDYILINDNLEKCIEETKNIIISERLKKDRYENLAKELDEICNK